MKLAYDIRIVAPQSARCADNTNACALRQTISYHFTISVISVSGEPMMYTQLDAYKNMSIHLAMLA